MRRHPPARGGPTAPLSFHPTPRRVLRSLSWGLLDPAPNQVAPSTLYRPPPGDYTHGDTVIGVLEAQGHPGTWEVYLEHANGTEPLQGAGGGLGAAEQNGWVSLLRFETRDFVSYSPARQVLYLRSGGTPTLKSIARDSRGLYVMFSTLDADVGEGAGGDHSFLSTDRGLSWREANCSTVGPRVGFLRKMSEAVRSYS
eukprot:COSAG04_NODE_481_length_13663_cov_9.055662_3_plen_198_part_00